MDSIRNDHEENDKLFFACLDLANYYMDISRRDVSKKYFERSKTYNSDSNSIFHIGRIHEIQYQLRILDDEA